MARIIINSYVMSYPVGGFLSWTLQWLVGLHRLGHEVHLVEKCGSFPNACYDIWRNVMSDDPSCGIAAMRSLMSRLGLKESITFVDASGRHHGLSAREIKELFAASDLYLDISGGFFLPLEDTWDALAATAGTRVCVDGEPGYTQMKMTKRLAEGGALPGYDHYFTVGTNVGSDSCGVPLAGKHWRATFDPVNLDLFDASPPPVGAPFTTVMAWQSHAPLEFDGRVYGQKDVEFARFMELPRMTQAPLEIAVGGKKVPLEELRSSHWRVRDSHQVTSTFDSFVKYIAESRGEFTVCKNVFVATTSGWFSDRSAAYLASGRPVVMQDTGFSKHLPCGAGLFAVNTAEEAAAAIQEIQGDWMRQSRMAREIAAGHLSAPVVLRKLLGEIGLA